MIFENLKKHPQRVISFGLAIIMILILVIGTIALYTDRDGKIVTAKAGSVRIELDYTGINLLDADGKDILNPGDGRDFKYKVTSLGSKSIDVYETIVLTVYDKNSQPLSLNEIDTEFDIYEAADVLYEQSRGWYIEDGTEPIEVRVLDDNTITYTRPVYTLSGNSELGDDKREIEYDDNDEEIPDYKENDFTLLFDLFAPNIFSGCILKTDVLVEAKQHRNTEQVDIANLQTSDLIISNGNVIKVVPADDEMGPQESEDGNWIYKDNGDGTVTIVDTNKVIESGETLVIPGEIDGKDVTGVEIDKILNNDNIDEDINIDFEDPDKIEIKEDLIFTYTNDVEGSNITGLTPIGAKMSSVTIPDTIKGQPVLDVDYNGIYDSSNGTVGISKVLKSIYTDEDVIATKGADYVFNYTDNGDGTATITGFTTIGKTLAAHINVPETIDGLTVTKMGTARGAFNGAQMTELTIPSTVTSMSQLGFTGNTNLKTVNYNTTAYSGYTNGQGMFTGSPIETLNFGAGITTIYDGMLSGTTAREITINSIEDITTINQYAFSNLKNTTSITFNGEVMLLDGHLTIPSTVTTIGRNAFSQILGVTEVTINENVSSIGVYAFVDNSITTVNYNSTATPSSWNNKAAGVFGNNAVEEVNFGAGITTIPRAFVGNTTASEITINSIDTITKIDAYAFAANKNVTSINITNANITAISDYTFQGCSSLTNVNFNGVVNEGLVIPEGVTSIGKNAFEGCTSISEITIPASVTSIGGSAFYGWTADQTIYVEGKTDVSGFATSAGLTSNCNATVIYNG